MISRGVGRRSGAGITSPLLPPSSSSSTLMHSCTHWSQIRAPGAWIIRRTSSSRLPQKEQRRDFFVSSLMGKFSLLAYLE